MIADGHVSYDIALKEMTRPARKKFVEDMTMSAHNQPYTPAEVRGLTGATRSSLLWLERQGIINPIIIQRRFRVLRRYCEADVATIRRIRYLQYKGLTLRGALAALPEIEQLEAQGRWCAAPGVERPGTERAAEEKEASLPEADSQPAA